jgi:pimeloyl-ACP methyl ester carboxylesterase
MSVLLTAASVVLLVLVVLTIASVAFSAIAERRNPPSGKFIDCQGLRLHYIERGNPADPAVIIFHGNGSMVEDIAISGLLDLLSSRNRVICFDRPGFGHSTRTRLKLWTPEAQANLFVDVLTKLSISNPVVLGHSWGTLVGVALALRDDYPVRGLTLVSGYYFPTFRLDFWLLSGPAAPIIGDILSYTLAPLLGLALLPSILRKLFAPAPVPESFKRRFPFSLALRPKQLQAAAEESAYLVPATARLQLQYLNIRCPVQLIHGDADQLIEKEQTVRLHRVLARSEVQLIPQAGHMVHHIDPEAISRTVLDWQRPIRRVASGR